MLAFDHLNVCRLASRDCICFCDGHAVLSQMLSMAEKSGLSIAQMQRANELSHRQRSTQAAAATPSTASHTSTAECEAELDADVTRIWAAMDVCINRGLRGAGHLPGGLKVWGVAISQSWSSGVASIWGAFECASAGRSARGLLVADGVQGIQVTAAAAAYFGPPCRCRAAPPPSTRRCCQREGRPV